MGFSGRRHNPGGSLEYIDVRGSLVAGALGIGGVESLIWMSAVAILVVAGLFAGALSLRAKVFVRLG